MSSAPRATLCLGVLLVLSAGCDIDLSGLDFGGGPTYPGCGDCSFDWVLATPGTARLSVGDTVRLSASSSRASGAGAPTITWQANDTVLARVDSAGLVTALAAGLVRIEAVASGHSPAYVHLQVDLGDTGLNLGVEPSSIRAGESRTCATTRSAGAYCWGRGDYDRERWTATPIASDVRFTSLALGWSHACGLDDAQTLRCWGWNGEGQLGRGTSTWAVEPAQAVGTGIWRQVEAAGSTTCAVDEHGAPYCWGSNYSGVFGNNGRNGALVPTAAAGGNPLARLSLSAEHACGLGENGEAFCWGVNVDGRLGDGTVQDRLRPAAVATALRFRAIATSATGTCALGLDGSAHCWGSLADVPRLTPTLVDGSAGYESVVAGMRHACALTSAGAAYCWGVNDFGQLGNATTATSWAPVAVSGDLTFSELTAGPQHTCGLTTGAVAYCWGSNATGQLGDGTNIDRAVPVRVAGQ